MSENTEITYSSELIRKAIHLNSINIPILYAIFDKEMALMVLVPLAILFIVVDLSMKSNEHLRMFVLKYFGKIMRMHEIKDEIVFNGATWVLISACICIAIFPKIIAVTGFAILIISDTAAALIGKKFGKNKLFYTKSIEGTLAFIFSAFLIIIVVAGISDAPWSFYVFGFLAAIIGGIVEAISGILKVDDNLSIPLSIGLVLWAFEFIARLFGTSYINLM